ncbi:MAG: hypothetical protein ABIH52_02130 [Candidatus Aenigmatarchaeota archaeon]
MEKYNTTLPLNNGGVTGATSLLRRYADQHHLELDETSWCFFDGDPTPCGTLHDYQMRQGGRRVMSLTVEQRDNPQTHRNNGAGTVYIRCMDDRVAGLYDSMTRLFEDLTPAEC